MTKLAVALADLAERFDQRLKQRRTILLDVFEALLIDSGHWPTIRKQLLKFLGDSGLRGDFLDTLMEIRQLYDVDLSDASEE